MRFMILILSLLVASYMVPYSPSPSFSPKWGIAWINSPMANGIYSDKGYDLSSSIGATLEHRQYLWGEVELSEGKYNWFILDHWISSLTSRGMEVSLAIGPVNTESFSLPLDLMGLTLDSPVVIDRYVSFIELIVKRYPLSYIAFSNEANFYYRNHPELMDEFVGFSQQVYERLSGNVGSTRILGIFGLTLIYEGNIIDDPFSVNFTKSLSGTYDIFGLSTYDGILNRPSLSLVDEMLNFYLSLSSSDNWAIVETGVVGNSTSDLIYQKEYLEFISSQRNLVFVCWLNLFDYPDNFLEVEKFGKTGLFFLNGSAKPVIDIFAGGVYKDPIKQLNTFTLIFYMRFTGALLFLVLLYYKRVIK